MILREEAIENYKYFKKSYKHVNNGHTVIDTYSEEEKQDSKITKEENIEGVRYNKKQEIF